MDAILTAARAIKAGEVELVIADGVESMSRADEIHRTTIGWRFVNPLMKAQYGIDSMPETAENMAEDVGISRADQDAFALRSQAKAAAAQANGRLAAEIAPVDVPNRKGAPTMVTRDEHPRATTAEALAGWSPPAMPRA